jgi:hypothetical protein
VAGRRSRGSWTHAVQVDERELARRSADLAEQLARDDPLWPGQLAMLGCLGLYALLPQRLAFGPNGLLPVAELAALVVLVVATRRDLGVGLRRGLTLGLLVVVTSTNLVSLGLLVRYLLEGGHARGNDLVAGGVLIWSTNLLVFAVWYWWLDRGGPLNAEGSRSPGLPDLLFPPMTDEKYAAPGWKPTFFDYLFVSLTNESAFSPTDTLPLTLRVKLLMGIQATAALVTVGVIIARAVNILGG